ncbi:hypothetical protein pb186bvf_018368 [Paramecium bursaria]
MSIIQVQTLADFQQMIITEKRVAFVVFVAEWCPPCVKLIDSLKKELEQQRSKINMKNLQNIDILIVDHDQCPSVVKLFNPTVLPYVYLFEKGKYIAQFGALDIFALQKTVMKAFEYARVH